MLDHPARVDAHVVGHHVRGKADAALPGAGAQVLQGVPAAQVGGDLVIHQRIGRSDRIRLAHHLLDALGGEAAFPQADQPQPGDAALRQQVQLLVRDLVEAA